MGSNSWEVVTPKMGNPSGDFKLVGSPKGAGHQRLYAKKNVLKLYSVGPWWGVLSFNSDNSRATSLEVIYGIILLHLH